MFSKSMGKVGKMMRIKSLFSNRKKKKFIEDLFAAASDTIDGLN